MGRMVQLHPNASQVPDIKASLTEFISSARAGRRDAVPDINKSPENTSETGGTSKEAAEVSKNENSKAADVQAHTSQAKQQGNKK
ncbi:hypothetical protein chiPu_0001019 [Chiloscyllium punctatum]|uniref:Uncharacterized protein n=1 Tax=Chiloscyllium punctatum TaxID=137246 RepID=A0A401RWW3_CHIPU|nr:hypothetical protein [Chiloscyllium punctatum]